MIAPPRHEAGFTLVELLVSVAVMAMMAALLASGLVTGRRAWERIETRTQAGEEVAAAQGALREIVVALYPQGSFQADAPFTEFDGSFTSMTFASAPLRAAGPGVPWSYRLSLSAGGDLVIDTVNTLSADPRRDTQRRVLLQGLDRLEIGYFGAAQPDGQPRWRTAWHNEPAPPDMIRIRAAFRPGDRRRWPEFVASPAATVHSLCDVDVNDGVCRG